MISFDNAQSFAAKGAQAKFKEVMNEKLSQPEQVVASTVGKTDLADLIWKAANLLRGAFREHIEHVFNANSHAAYARPSAALSWVDGNSTH